ncbi:unnamed protein product [Dracunculus medinensis]|uniref:AA_permease domain-containing protein n=1 Tax=Dracunculus medinensis TaxID=318479 RepID=A0A0N4U342_DRAME|nr:unnamed protein product [Dracunculus medinensis]
MSFGIFVIIPHVVTIAGPLAMLSLLLAFIVMIVSVMHVNELMSSMPKTCLLYNFIYACFGELPAFFTAWTALLDFIIILVIIAKSWSDHTKLLFGGFFHEYLVIKLSFSVNNEILEDEIDGFAMLIIIFSIVILCCNLRVSGTIAFVMLIVSGLATSSTILVGFFNANPNYWLSSKFFQRGMHGVFYLFYLFILALTSLLEETHNPRRRLPFIFSFITFLYSLLIFITIMIFTLTNDSTNFSIQMLPDIFNNVKIPAARFIFFKLFHWMQKKILKFFFKFY